MGNAGQYVVALAGNPNTGKSTIFNALTGLHQHTGNWSGKTVMLTRGAYRFNRHHFILVDLPGIYSLLPGSVDEQVARDFLCSARPDATIAVADATCLERNLSLILQLLEITPRVVVCVNLIDEAARREISIDLRGLAEELGVPVVATAARNGYGIEELKRVVCDLVLGKIVTSPRRVTYDPELESAVRDVEWCLTGLLPGKFLNPRWLALRLIDGDRYVLDLIREYIVAEGMFREQCRGENTGYHS